MPLEPWDYKGEEKNGVITNLIKDISFFQWYVMRIVSKNWRLFMSVLVSESSKTRTHWGYSSKDGSLKTPSKSISNICLKRMFTIKYQRQIILLNMHEIEDSHYPYVCYFLKEKKMSSCFLKLSLNKIKFIRFYFFLILFVMHRYKGRYFNWPCSSSLEKSGASIRQTVSEGYTSISSPGNKSLIDL